MADVEFPSNLPGSGRGDHLGVQPGATHALPDPGSLRDIPGPSPVGGGLQRFLDLLWVMAVTDFKRSYFGTVLGYLWSLVRPLALFAILLLVFTQIFRLGSEVPHYPVLLLLNIVLFGFVQEASAASVTSLVMQEPIVRKTQFPRLVVPLATVLTALMTLLVNLPIVIVFALAGGVAPTPTWLLAPVVVAALVVLACPVAMLLSCLYPKFRDLSMIWSVVITALFYATPVLYPIEAVPGGLRAIMMINPLSVVFVEARKWIIDPDAWSAAQAAGGLLGLAPAALITLALPALAILVFWREAPGVAEKL